MGINMQKEWTIEEFKNPSEEFRGAPFWSWNNRLDKEQLVKQVSFFKEMGMGGFHIHCRVGLDTEYLGPQFMKFVKACSEEGKRLGLMTYLYDEDRWPSGAAGGIVTKEEAFRSRYLYFIPAELREEGKEYGQLLRTYRITLKDGLLAKYEQVAKDAKGEDIWSLYLQISSASPWFNNQTYVDTLNKKAIERFIEVTHEAYADLLGNEFGKTIPSIFTDEPQFQRKETLDFSEEKRTLILPYTDEFEEFYMNRYGESFLEHFPEVVWDLTDSRISSTRYQYHDGIAELFAASFADILGSWCQEHNLMLTGHMMEEPTLLSQTSALGEAMRSYRSFQQPGIDMLCDRREYTTAKQAQSAAHQFDCPGVLSELYGVTNWDFDFRGHKLQGDWQAALGVTRRVHHLSWVSMAGEAKRDYPASIFYQSPWYQEYKMVEDHFARVNTALMRGKVIAKIGVIHPVESYWLHFGPKEQTAQVREALEQDFQNITKWLLFGQLDFDYLSESLLPDQNVRMEENKLCVGAMQYEAILVPGCETLRSTTIQILKDFVKEGGKVIFAGQLPRYVDAKISAEGIKLGELCGRVPMDKISVLDSLSTYRELEIRKSDGKEAEQYLYQLREDGDRRWMFIANGKKPDTPDVPSREEYQISMKGNWSVVCCDTQSGELHKKLVSYKNGWTVLKHTMDLQDSLLLQLSPKEDQDEVNGSQTAPYTCILERETIPQPLSIELTEPNVLLMDQADYRLDNGEWKKTEEILRIDNELRDKLGYPKRMEAFPQPWVQKEESGDVHTVELRFCIQAEEEFNDVSLAMEEADKARIIWNDRETIPEVSGWYVDECLKKIPLGKVEKGENILHIILPFGRKTNLEWCYLLGNFGVRTAGRKAVLTPMPEQVYFGDYTVQGLPFYAGNMIYRVPVTTKAGNYKLQISKFRAPLLKVSVDKKEWKPIAYAPYEADLGYLSEGAHEIEILSYGNRVNAFGAVHNCDETTEWFGPDSWRSGDERFAYEYQLKRMGVLKTPVLSRYSNR